LVAASLSTASAGASCYFEHETAVRGRLIRCESTKFYWDASGADAAIQKALDLNLAQADPQSREELRRRWSEQRALPGQRIPQSDFVALVRVEWLASSVTPFEGDDAPSVVEFTDQPRAFNETVRYIWRGPVETCQSLPPWSSVDLWITHPCCDTLPGADGCLLQMNYAKPAPQQMRDALSKALGDRAQ
jgi:hypothetical protein